MAEIDICLQDIGNRITELRKRLGWTQEELAEKSRFNSSVRFLCRVWKKSDAPGKFIKAIKSIKCER